MRDLFKGLAIRVWRLVFVAALLSCLFLPISNYQSPIPAHAQPPSPFAVEKLVGQNAPDFNLKDINGEQVSLSSFKGKVVLLNFWATWCPPCKEELPALNRLQQALKNKGFVVIAVSTDRSASDAREFIRKNPANFIIALDSNLDVSKNLYKVFMIPSTFLIDKRGIIVKRYFGVQDWAGKKMLKEIEVLL